MRGLNDPDSYWQSDVQLFGDDVDQNHKGGKQLRLTLKSKTNVRSDNYDRFACQILPKLVNRRKRRKLIREEFCQ